MTEMSSDTIETSSNEVLMHRLFDLARERPGSPEIARIDAVIYVRLAQAYGEVIPELQARQAA